MLNDDNPLNDALHLQGIFSIYRINGVLVQVRWRENIKAHFLIFIIKKCAIEKFFISVEKTPTSASGE